MIHSIKEAKEIIEENYTNLADSLWEGTPEYYQRLSEAQGYLAAFEDPIVKGLVNFIEQYTDDDCQWCCGTDNDTGGYKHESDCEAVKTLKNYYEALGREKE